MGGGDVDAWAAGLRAREAAGGRARVRSLRRQAAEDATWAGVLVGLRDRGDEVVVSTVAGRVHRGVLTVVGADCCVVASGGGRVLLAAGAVAWARGGGSVPDGGAPDDVTLAEVLGRLVDDEVVVSIVTTGGATVHGELRSVGRDVAVVAEGAAGRGVPAYVRLASVAEASWRVSG